MEKLKSVILKKLEESSHLKSAFEVIPRGVDDFTMYKAHNELNEALLNKALDEKVGKLAPLIVTHKQLTVKAL